MRQRFQQLLRQLPMEILVTAIVFLLALFTFSFIVHEAVYEKEDLFDNQVIHFFSQHASPGFIAAMQRITFFGSTTFLFPAYLVVIFRCLSRKNFQNALEIAVVGISSMLMMFALKQFFHRQRPSLPILKGISGYSFPSGHALSSFIFCAVLIHLAWTSTFSAVWKYIISVLLLLCALLIGLSRVVLNVHYATDVIGGFCLGIIWVIVSFAIMKRFRNPAPAATDNRI